MSHTSGPWLVEQGEVTDVMGDVFIAEIVSRDRPCAVQNPNEVEGNARLIAAAPDLLAACQHVLAWFHALEQQQHQELVQGQTLESAAKNWETMWDKPLDEPLDLNVVMAAVAKAEGR